MVQAEYRLFVRTAPEAEIKKRKGLKTFTAEDGIEVPHEALKEAKVADHSEAYYPYQKDISLRLADATRGASAWKTAFDATTRRSGQLKTVGYFFPARQKVRYAP